MNLINVSIPHVFFKRFSQWDSLFKTNVPLIHCVWFMTKTVCEQRNKKQNVSKQKTGGSAGRDRQPWKTEDRCSHQGEPPLTRLPHKLFCSFRLHSKVVELGYKIISQATCLSSLAVQLANWREWFPVWATIQNMAVKIWMISTLSLFLPGVVFFSSYMYFEYFSIHRWTNCRQDTLLTFWLTGY